MFCRNEPPHHRSNPIQSTIYAIKPTPSITPAMSLHSYLDRSKRSWRVWEGTKLWRRSWRRWEYPKMADDGTRNERLWEKRIGPADEISPGAMLTSRLIAETANLPVTLVETCRSSVETEG